ncbi:hypothetical protein ACI6QG_16255 [Roseococcus sp. DSY-14]|uniref:hypothetical protein n=1 Tax=Roseococcus sp. DSY-14 TaxID=3369650 RepID=UPI00387B8739
MRLLLLPLLALAACAPRTEPLIQPRPGAPDTNPAVVAACREQVTDILRRQDRSQLIREDERDARLGAEATPFTQRAPQDRMGRAFSQQRMIDDCVRDNTRSRMQGAQPAAAAAPAVETVPAAPTRRGR